MRYKIISISENPRINRPNRARRVWTSLCEKLSPKPIDVSDTKTLVKFILKKGTLLQIEAILSYSQLRENLEVYEAVISRCTKKKLALTSTAQRNLVKAYEYLVLDYYNKAQYEKVLDLNSRLFPLITDVNCQKSIINYSVLTYMTPTQITKLSENIETHFHESSQTEFVNKVRTHAIALKAMHSESTDDNPDDMDVLMGGEELTFDFNTHTMQIEDSTKAGELQKQTKVAWRIKFLEELADLRFVDADEEITTMKPEDRKRLEDFQKELSSTFTDDKSTEVFGFDA